MKKIFVISMLVLLAAVNVAVITSKSEGSKVTLNSLLKVAVADSNELPEIDCCAASLWDIVRNPVTQELELICAWQTTDCSVQSDC